MGGWLVCYNVGWMRVCCENGRSRGRTVISAVGCQPHRVFRLTLHVFVDSVVKMKPENVIRRVAWEYRNCIQYSPHGRRSAL